MADKEGTGFLPRLKEEIDKIFFKETDDRICLTGRGGAFAIDEAIRKSLGLKPYTQEEKKKILDSMPEGVYQITKKGIIPPGE